jgi:predicted permease
MHPRSILATLRLRIASLFRRDTIEHRFDDEIALHLDLETERNLAAGLSPAEARRAALIAFGGVERIREDHRDARGARFLHDLGADLRYAARWLRRSPAFTLSVLLTLALGIGGTTAMFCVVNGVLLKPLPYPDPERLVAIWSRLGAEPGAATSSPPDFREFRARATAFESIAGYYLSATNVVVDAEPHRVPGARISADLFPLLGATLSEGRAFRADEEAAGNDRVAIISHGMWSSMFGARPGVVGSSIVVDGEPHLIVGVTAPSFRFLDAESQLWRPMAFADTDNLNTRGNYFVFIVGRLRSGVDAATATSDLERVATQIRAEVPHASINGASVIPLHEQVVGAARNALLLLLGATALLLAIACANVAGLLLARASARERELAVRAGLGASRSRIVRQLVTEAMLLGAAGAALGIGVATVSVRALRRLDFTDVPRLDEARVDGTVFAVAMGLALGAALAFGLWPALRLTRRGHDALRGGGRSSATADHQRVRRLLVAGQVALSLVLLIGSGLLLRSFVAMLRVDPGFATSNIVTGSLPVNGAKYDDHPAHLWSFADQLDERLHARPGVTAAAITSALSLRGGSWGKLVTLGDRALPTVREQVPAVGYRLVSRGYFATLGVRRISGRTFEAHDGAGSAPVAVVNEAFARRFWPQGDPVGKIIWMGPPEEMLGPNRQPGYRFPRLTIVGVVADERFQALDAPPQPEVYQLYAQSTETPSTLYVAVRSPGDPATVAGEIRTAVRELDAAMPLAQVATARELMRVSSARRRLSTLLVAGFAVLALGLAMVGIYGIAAQFVTQRTRELGIRIAVGAGTGQVMRLVLREGGLTALAGATAGLVGAVAGARLMRDVLFGVTPTDPVTYLGITIVLVAVVLAATSVPALRAARIAPASVLRGD